MADLEFEFTASVIEWRGPAPFFFAVVPTAESEEIGALSGAITYGWGAIPVAARIGGLSFTTSLFPKDGAYLLPLKVAVREATGVQLGDRVPVKLGLTLRG
ncbi:MAG: DUF1905 domain-containing protein [Propionibacteriaceae bacterium]|nr:DUF1905 domain-containing protein [Propionibacteriaceae bacterium]